MREDKRLFKQRRKGKKASIREQHAGLTFMGIERRVNGSKLGLRKRLELLREL